MVKDYARTQLVRVSASDAPVSLNWAEPRLTSSSYTGGTPQYSDIDVYSDLLFSVAHMFSGLIIFPQLFPEFGFTIPHDETLFVVKGNIHHGC